MSCGAVKHALGLEYKGMKNVRIAREEAIWGGEGPVVAEVRDVLKLVLRHGSN